MHRVHNVLVLGASYGSLLGTKLVMAQHRVTLVCTSATASLINERGTVVRFPVSGRGLVEVASCRLPGTLIAASPEQIRDLESYDLVVLGMQESQYGAPGVRELMGRIARAETPCLAIMNMPPLPYLKRIPGLATESLEACYTDPAVWRDFNPRYITLASPDPQAFRVSEEPKNVLHVGLPTNFKAAAFDHEASTMLLRRLAADIEAARLCVDDTELEIPVKLKVHQSVFVPLAKWPMLIAGNYRCIRQEEMVSIDDAVHNNVEKSREVYDWVVRLCRRLGAEAADLVPFEKYAKVAEGLTKPSSAARALFGGAPHVERVDRLVSSIASQLGLGSETVDEIVALVDDRLGRNRLARRVECD